MKRIFTKRTILPVLALALSTIFQVQAAWTDNNIRGRAAAPAQTTEAAEIFLGHCDVTGQIYEMDGLSLSYDSRIGAGIVLPKEIIKNYEGGMITAMYVGWDDPSSTNYYN